MKQNRNFFCMAPAPVFLQITSILQFFSLVIAIILVILLIVFLVNRLVKKTKLTGLKLWTPLIAIVALVVFSFVPLTRPDNYLWLYVILFSILLAGQLLKKMLDLKPNFYITLLLIILIIVAILFALTRIQSLKNLEDNNSRTDPSVMLLGCGGSWW
jgi:hypothetical protein